MAENDNRIKNFHFWALVVNVIPPTEPVEIDQRPALDGTTIKRAAAIRDENGDIETDSQGQPLRMTQGKPFQLLSRVDAANYPAAIALFDEYIALIGHDPVDLVQGGLSMASRGFSVAVLSVEMLRAARLIRSVGGINGGGAILEARWELIAIANSQGA
jgi:hypothetical protein